MFIWFDNRTVWYLVSLQLIFIIFIYINLMYYIWIFIKSEAFNIPLQAYFIKYIPTFCTIHLNFIPRLITIPNSQNLSITRHCNTFNGFLMLYNFDHFLTVDIPHLYSVVWFICCTYNSLIFPRHCTTMHLGFMGVFVQQTTA